MWNEYLNGRVWIVYGTGEMGSADAKLLKFKYETLHSSP